MVVQVEDVGNDSKLQQEVGVRGVSPRDVEIGKAIGEEEQPNENYDHIAGQTALRVQMSKRLEDGGVKTRSKLKYSSESAWYIYELGVKGRSEIRRNVRQRQDHVDQWQRPLEGT